jgi:hypothetical protein
VTQAETEAKECASNGDRKSSSDGFAREYNPIMMSPTVNEWGTWKSGSNARRSGSNGSFCFDCTLKWMAFHDHSHDNERMVGCMRSTK